MAEKKGEEFNSKELGSWLKAVNGGKRIMWPSEVKTSHEKGKEGAGRRVGMIKKVETSSILEQLVRMTVNDDDTVREEGGKVTNQEVVGSGKGSRLGYIATTKERIVSVMNEHAQAEGFQIKARSGENDVNIDEATEEEQRKGKTNEEEGIAATLPKARWVILNEGEMVKKNTVGKGGLSTWKQVVREKENVVLVVEVKKRLFNDLTNGIGEPINGDVLSTKKGGKIAAFAKSPFAAKLRSVLKEGSAYIWFTYLKAAKEVADYLGTIHHEEDQIIGVKMVISGEGSDEIFGGYLYSIRPPGPQLGSVPPRNLQTGHTKIFMITA
ncbi:asparagine synthetase [glutamine-hydrolyzing] 3-like [Senna tora]|uniref:Asparagine synthetase [glutamine-hydrolyzing] 3-like n=1 Tax=Senna tora TaxID=362788 RepID=A0A834SV60_9FABA|nr:asparagine synthetase [glutamine-hydrolyzing] 3-like [Senna tora]